MCMQITVEKKNPLDTEIVFKRTRSKKYIAINKNTERRIIIFTDKVVDDNDHLDEMCDATKQMYTNFITKTKRMMQNVLFL